MTSYRKIILFVLICLVVLAAVRVSGSEHAAMARHFMRSLFRHLF